MGSYHSLLSSLVAYHQQAGSSENEKDVTFVKVLARVMGKNLIKRSYKSCSPNQSKQQTIRERDLARSLSS